MEVYVDLNVPDEKDGTKITRTILKTVFDINKMLNQESVLTFSARLSLSHFKNQLILSYACRSKGFLFIELLQSFYMMKNMTFSDKFIPLTNNHFILDLRFVGKVEGRKNSAFFCHMELMSSIKKLS